MRRSSGSARDLIDTAAGEISREIFVNEDIYEEEKDTNLQPRLALRRA